MTRTLTLELDEELVARAEEISRVTGRSVSEVVSDLLNHLPPPPSPPGEAGPAAEPSSGDPNEIPGLTPIVRSLIGILKGSGLDEEDYYRHLEEKYL